MPTAHHDTMGRGATDSRRVGRRRFLQVAATTGAVLGAIGTASATPARSNGKAVGFPPAGTTEWSDPVTLGDGEAKTFTTVTPSGTPKYHGLYLERDALDGLPSAADLADDADSYTDKYGATGEALEIHHKWSLEFFVPFPATDATPFTFLGLNWNPDGHPPDPVWGVPHFDIHFHMLPTATVDAITGPAAPTYSLPEEYIPEGYARGPVVDERVITDMGEHMAPGSAPELNGGTFTNTLIWGAYDPDGDETAELTFVEPMITRAYLRDHRGVDRRAIPHPETHATAGTYPTTYSVRDVPSDDAIAVVVQAFEDFEGDD